MALEDVNDNGTARLNQLVVTNPTGTDKRIRAMTTFVILKELL